MKPRFEIRLKPDVLLADRLDMTRRMRAFVRRCEKRSGIQYCKWLFECKSGDDSLIFIYTRYPAAHGVFLPGGDRRTAWVLVHFKFDEIDAMVRKHGRFRAMDIIGGASR